MKFAENKKFTLEFSDGDILQGKSFRKSRDYFLMSMACFIEIENDIMELTQYTDIEKISEFVNRIIKNGIDYGHKSAETEILYGGKTYEVDILKNNCSALVDVVEFFYHFLKRKRFVLIFSFYKELINFGITHEKKDKKSDITGYSLKIRKKKVTKLIFLRTYFLMVIDLFQNKRKNPIAKMLSLGNIEVKLYLTNSG